jgi:hypothetical protein
MNHDCHGDIFMRWGKRWGRCFGDSTIFELLEGTEFCPACKRPWIGMENRKDFYPDLDNDILVKVDIPQYKYMLDQKTAKIQKLEEELETWKAMYKKEKGITAF